MCYVYMCDAYVCDVYVCDVYVYMCVMYTYICGFVCNGNSELTVKELRKPPRKAPLTVSSLLRSSENTPGKLP